MAEQKWGVGNRKDEKAFDTVKVGNHDYELIFGEHPHQTQDNTIYARKGNFITGFDGHRKPIKIEIEEFNYLKESELSGDQIRKGGSVKVFLNDVQIYDDFCRNYEMGYRKASQFILDMEMNWDWFPNKVEQKIGKIVGYYEQLMVIKRVIIDQACLVLETLDGKPMKRRLWQEDDDELESTAKVEITSPHIWWYPKLPQDSVNV